MSSVVSSRTIAAKTGHAVAIAKASSTSPWTDDQSHRAIAYIKYLADGLRQPLVAMTAEGRLIGLSIEQREMIEACYTAVFFEHYTL